jgi:hypothetical protein
MFPTLQLEVMERFTGVKQHFRASRAFRGDPSQTAKGLVFIQLYAIHEYTVQHVVRLASAAIAAHAHNYADLRPSLLALFLDPQFCSLRDCSHKNSWDRRIELFDRAASREPISLPQAPLPTDGTHFRHTHVELILKVLGVSRAPTLRRRHLFRIDEVVDNRNSIAHGEETAANIGRRYSRPDIQRTIRQMESVCLRLILIVSEHCGEPTKHCR